MDVIVRLPHPRSGGYMYIYIYIPNSQRLDLLVKYFSSYEKSLILSQFSKLKKNSRELENTKVTFISELAGKICGGLKYFCPKKPLPS